MKRSRILSLLSTAALLAGCTSLDEARPAAIPTVASTQSQPKLVVLIVIDQFRADSLTRFDSYFSDGGFKRLGREGAHFTGHYGQYATYTGPGHAILFSGSYPYVNGIATNKFWNERSQRSESMAFDATARVLGLDKADPDLDVSPRNFNGSTVGDELALATGGRSKTIAVGVKGRGAILLGGRLGKTYWMNDEDGSMTTSTYYAKALPEWVGVWNEKKLADKSFGAKWERALPDSAYVDATPDDAAFEGGSKGLGKTFPHVVDGKLKSPGPAFYEAFSMTPFANDYELDFAKAALENERLGQRGVTDVIAISLSAPDLAGHDFGPFSQEAEDLAVRTDRQIGDFLTWLDARIDPNERLVVVTADHGATPVPEQMTAMGFGAGRIKKATIAEAIESALSTKFGGDKGHWVIALEDPHVFLNRRLIADRALDAAEVERVAGEAAARLEGFGGYFTRAQLLRGEVPNTDLGHAVLRSYYAPRGGDVVLWTLPFYFWGKYAEKDAGSTHGTLYRYDALVPVFIAGGQVKRGDYGVREMIDLAPTIAELLRISPPAGSEGSALELQVPSLVKSSKSPFGPGAE